MRSPCLLSSTTRSILLLNLGLLLCGAALAPARAEDRAPAPVALSYEMPMDGFVALEIRDQASGNLVRHLVAETHRPRGPVREEWDLRDDAGQPVPPGDYIWKAYVRPPLKLTYELTLYNAGVPGWWAPAPAKGGGGWLADHTMASEVAVQPDRVWITAPVAESGHSLIATDIDGTKQWGTGMMSFGFDGPRQLAADDRCAYMATPNFLYRVDPHREFAARAIFTWPNDADVPWMPSNDPSRSSGGIAVRDGRVYYAVDTPSRWLRPAFVADEIDPDRCQPLVYLFKGRGRRAEREDKNYGFYEYDELMLLYATFGCDRTPAETPGLANTPLNSTTAASFGDAPKTGPYKGSVVVAFSKPVTVSSVLVPDGGIQVLAMKPGKMMPTTKAEAATAQADALGAEPKPGGDDLFDEFKEDEGMSDDWVLIKSDAKPGRPAVVTVPAGGLKTTALRFKTKRLAYSLAMAHRVADVAPQAKLVFREGDATKAGGWRLARGSAPVTESNPGMVAMVWSAKQRLRGITLVRPPGGNMREHIKVAVETWTGAGSPDSPAALDDDKSWQIVQTLDYDHEPMFQQVDFGRVLETAGLRLRYLSSVASQGRYEVGFESWVAYQPLGDDPQDLPPDLSQRVTVFKVPAPDDDKAPAVVERHIPMTRPGDLAFDAAGMLYCIGDGQVVTVPLEPGAASKVVVGRDKLEAPLALAVGPDGLLYVTDNGPKIIKVFKPTTGELVRTLGTPGGLKTGAWDPTRFHCPSSIAVDRLGRIWVTDWTYVPKRVVRWTADGKVDKEFFGPTQYGGGGMMDARDRRFVYYLGMKFEIDWDQHTWKFNGLLGENVDRTIYHGGHRYLVGPTPGSAPLVTIAEEQDGLARLMVQAGSLAEWPALRDVPEIRAKFGKLDPAKHLFVWSDLNGNRKPEPDEAQVIPVPADPGRGWIVGEDLTLVGNGRRLRPKSIRPDGVPVYDLQAMETYTTFIRQSHTDNPWGDDQGRIFMTGARLIAADGKTRLWEYENKYNTHAGFYTAPFGHNRPPGVLNQEHSPIAHIKVGKEEYFITNSDAGDWFAYTADGLLAGCILGGPVGYGKKAWSMPEWEPGKTDLSDLRPGQEHYQGCVVNTDGHVYAIAGHNHMSVVRVDGLEQAQRLNGSVTVSVDDVEKTRVWALAEATRRQAAAPPKVAKILQTGGSPDINGAMEEWPTNLVVTVEETIVRGLHTLTTNLECEAALAYDTRNLYVAMRTRDASPLRNNAADLLTLFKGGDAAEVTLGLDPAADPKRTTPVAGDLRLLFAMVKGRPVAVLYKPVDPTASPDLHREFSSPVGRVRFDRVEVLSTAKVAFQTKQYKAGSYWTVEATVPWTALGADPPKPGTTLRGDLGYLASDENGTQTVGRHYWSGTAQTVICDLPSEARLNPSLWGQFEAVKSGGALKLSVAKSIDGTTGASEGEDLDLMLEGK